jgi:flagellar motor switch protein FliN/FliY
MEKYPQDVLTVDVVYESGLQGNNIFVLHEQDAGIFADLMLKGEGKNPPAVLTETHLELIGKAMEKMMAASTIALTQLLDKPIKMSAPALNLTSLKEDKVLYVNVDEPLVKIAFKLKVEGLLDSEMLQILPLSFAKQLASEVLKVKELKQEVSNSIKLTQDNDQVEVTSAELPSFTEGDQLTRTTTLNLDLIMDINLELSVELGKTKKKIKEILELTNGSLVELDKLAGEPVDILVNGNHLAKGEVVVIDENFGVRVIEILSPTERIKKLR